MQNAVEWLAHPLTGVMSRLEDAGYVAYTVGGCVRDAVLGVECNDIDIATNATPDQVKEVFYKKGFGKLYPTGLKHGTWTLTVEKQSYEITTFRADVTTDGRHAEVEFVTTMEEDAQRRDFTMNAMYMDKDGIIFDPTGQGRQDLKDRRVRFVGDAAERCTEDYLRILRLFRFCGKLNTVPGEEELDAVRATISGLGEISGERKWAELKKILSLPNPTQVVAAMHVAGVFKSVALPCNLRAIQDLYELEKEGITDIPNRWARRYHAVTGGVRIPFPVSKEEQKQIEQLTLAMKMPEEVATQEFGVVISCNSRWLLGHHLSQGKQAFGLSAKFPLTSEDFTSIGIEGPAVGKAIRAAKDAWYMTNLKADRDTLFEEGKRAAKEKSDVG